MTYTISNGYRLADSNEGISSAITELSNGSAYITQLELHPTFQLSVDEIARLGEAIVKSTSLTSLNVGDALRDWCTPDDKAKHLFSALSNYSSLQYLKATGMDLSPVATDHLCRALRKNTNLVDLDLSGSTIPEERRPLLIGALKMNATLVRLNLGSMHLDNGIATHLAEMLNTNTNLRSLNVSRNPLGSAAMLPLSLALTVNTSLTELDLSNNFIGDEGIEQLSEALKVNRTLDTLHLNGNAISSTGAKHLVQMLGANSTLTGLYLQNNEIADDGAQELSEMIASNSTLTDLNLASNYYNGSALLVQAAQYNSTLTSLNVENQWAGGLVAESIVRISLVNSTLTRLKTSIGFGLLPEGATTLLSALHCNPSLLHLSTIMNHQESIDAITERNRYNSTRRYLSLYERVRQWGCQQVFASYSQDDKEQIQLRVGASLTGERNVMTAPFFKQIQCLKFGMEHLFDDWSVFESAVASAGLDLEAGVGLLLRDRAHSQTLQR